MEAKERYWEHYASHRHFRPESLTDKRLEKAKAGLWDDMDFWNDVLLRHNGHGQTPEQMKATDRFNYEHCMCNMTGMIMGWLWQEGIIK